MLPVVSSLWWSLSISDDYSISHPKNPQVTGTSLSEAWCSKDGDFYNLTTQLIYRPARIFISFMRAEDQTCTLKILPVIQISLWWVAAATRYPTCTQGLSSTLGHGCLSSICSMDVTGGRAGVGHTHSGLQALTPLGETDTLQARLLLYIITV